MALTDNLKDIITSQKETLSDLENEFLKIESNDLTIENDKLSTQLINIKADSLLNKEKLKDITEKNTALKSALHEQIYSEKLSIINISEKKLDIYFKSNYDKELNRLTSLEKAIKQRINKMATTLAENNIDISDELFERLDAISILLNEKVTMAKSDLNKLHGSFSQNEKSEFESLKNEEVSDSVIQKIIKKNNIESFIGLNIINKLGILLIIIGVVVASQYMHSLISDYLKGIMLFGFGGAMLVIGELLNRKNPNTFSLGITAGGVAILYVALVASYFGLKILGIYPAILVCILITGVAFLLSTRYNAQVILAFALAGAYLPMFSVDGNNSLIYPAMVYFIIINLLSLTVSFNKKWYVSTFLGLFLNIIGTSYITLNSISSSIDGSNIALTIVYQLFVFFIYTMIPIIGTFKLNLKFTKYDNIVFIINTFFSSLIMYLTFLAFDLNDYLGLSVIIFAASYLLLGRIIEVKLKNEIPASKLFFLTGFTFVVLIIPFQFGETWLSLGWLVEGVIIAAYGILNNEKKYKKIGLIIASLCFGSFLIFDLFSVGELIFTFKYLSMTVGNLVILGCLIYKKTLSGKYEKIYKYISLVNIWIFINYIVNVELYSALSDFNYDYFYMCSALSIVLGFLFAYCLPRINMLCDKGVKIISGVIYVISIILLARLNIFGSPFPIEASFLQTAIGTIILVVISLLSMLALYDLIRFSVLERWINIQLLPIILSLYFLYVLTQNLITHYNLVFSNMFISIFYVLTSFLCIIIGFYKRYPLLRRFGLGLSVLTVGKLFLIDLVSLTKGYQIISYFAFGVTLVAISFVYQYFDKRLELKLEVRDSVE